MSSANRSALFPVWRTAPSQWEPALPEVTPPLREPPAKVKLTWGYKRPASSLYRGPAQWHTSRSCALWGWGLGWCWSPGEATSFLNVSPHTHLLSSLLLSIEHFLNISQGQLRALELPSKASSGNLNLGQTSPGKVNSKSIYYGLKLMGVFGGLATNRNAFFLIMCGTGIGL